MLTNDNCSPIGEQLDKQLYMANSVTEHDFMMAMSFDDPQHMNSDVIEAYLVQNMLSESFPLII